MALGLDRRVLREISGPNRGHAEQDLPNELEDLMSSVPEISAIEHAIRMAPAGWDFESDEPETSR